MNFVLHHIALALGAHFMDGCLQVNPEYDFNLVDVGMGYESDLGLPPFGILYLTI